MVQNTLHHKTAIRLKEFIDDLGMSIEGFRKSCGIKSKGTIPYSVSQGNAVSPRVLQQIIKTYPQLNKDYIVTGVGDMYLDQFSIHKNISKSAYIASQNSAFGKIQQAQDNHDFALNELIIKNNKTNEGVTDVMTALNKHVLTLSTQISELKTESNNRTAVVNKAVETLLGGVSHLITHIENTSEKWEQIFVKKENELRSEFTTIVTEHLKLIKDLDIERKQILKDTLLKYYNTGYDKLTKTIFEGLENKEKEVTGAVMALLKKEISNLKVSNSNQKKLGNFTKEFNPTHQK